MCGIVGAYGGQCAELDNALDIIAHRGPDGTGITRLPEGLLGHTRLAIIDVDGGQQPLNDPLHQRWLVCNGEIYNHRDLRRQSATYPFRTDSDSEVILALYEHHGVEAVRHLDGMFAFALVDDEDIYLARDPLGIKPLYYGWRDDCLYFGSEVKALQVAVDEVHEFPAGHYYTTAGGFVRYYDLEGIVGANGHDESPDVDRIQQTLREAVHKRLMSEVPVGVYLSGGLDSSIIAALAAEVLPGVHSFSVGVEGSVDCARARDVAAYLGTTHHEYIYTPADVQAVLPEIIYYLESFDPLLVRSSVANYFLARLAADTVTVVLCGEGADELYAGYHYLKDFPTAEALHEELLFLTNHLHGCNLQRCDRMNMAHGLEGRVPFLDAAFIELSFAVPPALKIRGEQEKWILRKAFEDLLPDHIVWRTKQQFAEGAGSHHVIQDLAEAEISDTDFAREVAAVETETGHRIGSKEELYYYRIYHEYFGSFAGQMIERWPGT